MERSIANWIVDYLLNSAWQVPLVFLVALLAQTLLSRLHTPTIVHRMWVGALTFATVLPACHIAAWPGITMWRNSAASAGGRVHISVAPGLALAAGIIHLPAAVLELSLGLYLATFFYFAGRIARGLWTASLLRSNACASDLSESVRSRWNALCARIGVLDATLLVSHNIGGPAMVGMRTVLVPTGFIERVRPQDLDAALAHELAHVRRGDFAKNLACTVIALPVSYHPCAWLLQKSIAQSREAACDAIAADALDGRRNYARSLLRLALTIPAGFKGRATPAVGIFEGNNLERRVKIMMNQGKELRGAGRILAISAALLLTAGAVVSIPSVHLTVHAAEARTTKAPTLHLPAQKMAQRIESQVQPKYPAKAKADHNTVDGSVVLGVRINTKGVPTDVRVVKSLRKDYDDSALTAVRQWRWKPVSLNGKPVAVKTDVTITYSMKE